LKGGVCKLTDAIIKELRGKEEDPGWCFLLLLFVFFFSLISQRMLKYSLLAVPAGVYYLTHEVEKIKPVGNEFDRYRVAFSEEEKELLQNAFQKIGSSRSPSQLMASAFYRSPSFAFERVFLGLFFLGYDKNADLFTREWKKGEKVSNSFTVETITNHQISLNLGVFTTELFFGNLPELQFATFVNDSDLTESMTFRSLIWAHGIYSRALLAGAKFQLIRDLKSVVKN
jgi:hypothetical protein